jgi:shikimate kinase
LEKKLSKSIADIFKEKGEEYFRKLESEALLELSQKTQIVLSCGGGIVELEENRRILKSKFFVVYLDAPWEIIWKRIKDDASRPKAIAPEAMVKSLFLRRKPLYEETADLTLKCGKKSETEIAEEVRGHLSGW